MSIWNQLYINIKSLISWQFCLKDMNYISSLTVSMVRGHKLVPGFQSLTVLESEQRKNQCGGGLPTSP